MLSLLLITALAVQYPQSSKPATTDTTASRSAQAAPRGSSQSATSRQAFHDRMRELWSDHIVYTRSFIVSASADGSVVSAVMTAVSAACQRPWALRYCPVSCRTTSTAAVVPAAPRSLRVLRPRTRPRSWWWTRAAT